jgi:hypothetical protein
MDGLKRHGTTGIFMERSDSVCGGSRNSMPAAHAAADESKRQGDFAINAEHIRAEKRK